MRNVYEIWSEYLKETDHLEDTSISVRIIREWQGVYWIHWALDRVQLVGPSECGI
jgi:hypothetical protein